MPEFMILLSKTMRTMDLKEACRLSGQDKSSADTAYRRKTYYELGAVDRMLLRK